MNAFDQMRDALAQAKEMDNAAMANTAAMANLIAGKLEGGGVGHAVLKQLKDELRRWNPHTNRWREAK